MLSQLQREPGGWFSEATLGFVAGLYGMNVSPDASPWNMPELGWRFGYPFALGLMGLITLAFLGYFWRKGWFR